MMYELLKGMKSVMVFDPRECQRETEERWVKWWNHNKKSAVGDKYVPDVAETRKLLNAGERDEHVAR